MFASLTDYSEELYRNNSTEVAEALVEAMKNPGTSLKQGNIISVWKMDTNVENTFAKWYCTYGAARISPEFFPYINSMTQQRTRWGNAVDRCKNAAETWYKIGTTPAQWALIIYDAGGKFWIYGHVGKVMHYDNSLKKIIVRDMAWIARGTMSDRREDLTTAQVKCYIYNNKSTTEPTPTTEPITHTETVHTWAPIIPIQTPVVPPSSPTTIPPSVDQPIVHPVVIPPVLSPVTPPVIDEPIIHSDNKLSLELNNLSDIAKHFIQHNTLSFTLVTKKPLSLWSSAKLTLEIKDKTTWKNYSWLIPFSFGIISTNDILKADISKITFVNDGKVDISILWQKAGNATIIITMDGTKISKFNLEVK